LGYVLPAAGQTRVFHPLERAPAGRTNSAFVIEYVSQRLILLFRHLRHQLLITGRQQLMSGADAYIPALYHRHLSFVAPTPALLADLIFCKN
jgi:hypothetical protein